MIYSKVSIDNKKEAGFKIYEKSKKIPQALESECLNNKTENANGAMEPFLLVK